MDKFHRCWAIGDRYFKKENKSAKSLEYFKRALSYANPEDDDFKSNCSVLHYNIALVLKKVLSHNHIQKINYI